jgi:hypothetical protein
MDITEKEWSSSLSDAIRGAKGTIYITMNQENIGQGSLYGTIHTDTSGRYTKDAHLLHARALTYAMAAGLITPKQTIDSTDALNTFIEAHPECKLEDSGSMTIGNIKFQCVYTVENVAAVQGNEVSFIDGVGYRKGDLIPFYTNNALAVATKRTISAASRKAGDSYIHGVRGIFADLEISIDTNKYSIPATLTISGKIYTCTDSNPVYDPSAEPPQTTYTYTSVTGDTITASINVDANTNEPQLVYQDGEQITFGNPPVYASLASPFDPLTPDNRVQMASTGPAPDIPAN